MKRRLASATFDMMLTKWTRLGVAQDTPLSVRVAFVINTCHVKVSKLSLY